MWGGGGGGGGGGGEEAQTAGVAIACYISTDSQINSAIARDNACFRGNLRDWREKRTSFCQGGEMDNLRLVNRRRLSSNTGGIARLQEKNWPTVAHLLIDHVLGNNARGRCHVPSLFFVQRVPETCCLS